MGQSKWKFMVVLCLGLLIFAGASIAQARVFRNTAVWQRAGADTLIAPDGHTDSTLLYYNVADTTQCFPLFHYGAFVNKQAYALTAEVQNTAGSDSCSIDFTFQVSEDQVNYMTISGVYATNEGDSTVGAHTVYSIRNATFTNVPPCKWCRLILTSATANTESCWVWLDITGHFLKTQE